MSEFETEDAAEMTENIEQARIPDVINSAIWKSLIDGLASLDHRVTETHAESSHDTLAELRNCVLLIQQRAAALRELIDQKFVAAIQAHGPIEIGTFQYIVAIARSTRCLNTMATAECLLGAVGGDLNKFCEQLVAQPFKPASVRAFIAAEEYQRCFETVERTGIDEEPVERLMKVDTRFLKPRA